jgi:hypothetical protein
MGKVRRLGGAVYETSDLNKILIATATINYLASNLNLLTNSLFGTGVMEPQSPYILKSAKECETQLKKTKEKLVELMEELGNFMSNRDAVDEADIHFTGPAFDVVYSREIKEEG